MYFQTLEGKVKGIILTGWQRYNHFSALCELLPVGIPSLVLALHFLNNVELTTPTLLRMAQVNVIRYVYLPLITTTKSQLA